MPSPGRSLAMPYPQMHNPVLNPAVRLAPVETGYLAYDPAADRLHELNPVAALIVELCDGSRPVREVQDLVKPLLPEGTAEEEVSRWIDEGARAGLFTTANGSPPPAREELSAEELHKLAKRLRDRGKIETAYRCQRRATDLDPQDASAWSYLGDLAHILGWRDKTRAAYEKCLEIEPDDAEIRHLLIALRDEPPPPRASDECIQQMYQRFSSFFEFNLCEELSYQGPQRLHDLLKQVLGDRTGLAVLELGCGSGLAGLRLKEFAATMVGVDLSPEMIALARARNIYDRLEVAEITQWLGRNQEQFDLVASCDCLIYFGDLRQVAVPVAKILVPGGILAFSVERGAEYPFRLTDNGRYTHTAEHIREVAADAGLEVLRLDEGFLRTEYGEDVIALFAALRNPVR
ncbi:MAG TPA: methyltransferase domain-containing protein [Candidatus Acidoferrales bacterium]|nr:methyltransferase domain-containing protein [Candidatus Acidoferrales bacterium]